MLVQAQVPERELAPVQAQGWEPVWVLVPAQVVALLPGWCKILIM